jgi:hypothetical protein
MEVGVKGMSGIGAGQIQKIWEVEVCAVELFT